MASRDFTLSRGKTFAFALIVVFGFFGVLELGARLSGLDAAPAPRILLRRMDVDITFPFMQADRELFWAPVPGFRGRFLERPVAINSFGVRGPEPAPEADGIRVLSFGDSITFGYGVADDETYPAAMGRALAARGVEVVNAGVTGYTSHQVLGLVRRLAPRLQPRLVTICIGWNDGNRRAVDDREWARRLSRASPLGGALERVALFRAMTNLYVRSVVTADKRSGATTQRVPLAHYRENLTSIVAACRASGAIPVFVDLPHVQPLPASLNRTYRDALQQTSRALGAPLLSVGDLGLDSPRHDTGELFLDALHLRPEGNAQLGQLLARQLVERGLV